MSSAAKVKTYIHEEEQVAATAHNTERSLALQLQSVNVAVHTNGMVFSSKHWDTTWTPVSGLVIAGELSLMSSTTASMVVEHMSPPVVPVGAFRTHSDPVPPSEACTNMTACVLVIIT